MFLRFSISLLTLMLGFVATANPSLSPIDLVPIGHQECSSQTLRDIYYSYDLLQVEAQENELAVSLAVRNYVCDLFETKTENVYSWKLIPDDSFLVRTSFEGKSFTTQIKATNEDSVYLAVIRIPYTELLSAEELDPFAQSSHFVSKTKDIRFRHWNKSYGALPWSFSLQVRIEKDQQKISAQSVHN